MSILWLPKSNIYHLPAIIPPCDAVNQSLNGICLKLVISVSVFIFFSIAPGATRKASSRRLRPTDAARQSDGPGGRITGSPAMVTPPSSLFECRGAKKDRYGISFHSDGQILCRESFSF